jgi:hypothetical protein
LFKCKPFHDFSGSEETVCGVKVESPLFTQAPSPIEEECDLKNSDYEEENVSETAVKSR